MKPTRKQIREVQDAAKVVLDKISNAATAEARTAAEAEFDALMDRADQMFEERTRHQRLAKLKDSVAEVQDVRTAGADMSGERRNQRARIADRYIRNGRAALTDAEYRLLHTLDERESLFMRWLTTPRATVQGALTPEQDRLNAALHKHERALISTGISSAPKAGYTIPEGFMAEIIADMAIYGPMADFGFVRRITTATGNDLPMPLEHAAATAKAAIIGEGATFSDVDPSFGQLTMTAYKYGTRQQISVELLEDEGVGIEAYIRTFVAECFGRAINEHFTTGNGTSKPHGLTSVIQASTGRRDDDSGLAANHQRVQVGTSNSVKADDLIDLQLTGIDPAYQARSVLQVNNTVRTAMRKFKDTDGQYLWVRDLREGAPEMFNGFPLYINQALADPNGSAVNVAVTMDPMSYLCRQVGAMTMDRSDQEEFSKDLVVIKTRWRLDGAPIRPRGIAVLQDKA